MATDRTAAAVTTTAAERKCRKTSTTKASHDDDDDDETNGLAIVMRRCRCAGAACDEHRNALRKYLEVDDDGGERPVDECVYRRFADALPMANVDRGNGADDDRVKPPPGARVLVCSGLTILLRFPPAVAVRLEFLRARNYRDNVMRETLLFSPLSAAIRAEQQHLATFFSVTRLLMIDVCADNGNGTIITYSRTLFSYEASWSDVRTDRHFVFPIRNTEMCEFVFEFVNLHFYVTLCTRRKIVTNSNFTKCSKDPK